MYLYLLNRTWSGSQDRQQDRVKLTWFVYKGGQGEGKKDAQFKNWGIFKI